MSALLEIKFFKDLSDVLSSMSDEDFTRLEPGNVAPPEAVFIGPMSEHLKKLLVFSHDVLEASQERLHDLIRVGNTLSPEEIEIRLQEISEHGDFVKLILGLFKVALDYEYNEGEVDTTHLGYDENFVVYYIPQK
jgi:hypothetical protein